MTNNSGSATGIDTDGHQFDSRRVPFFLLRHSPNHLSFVLRHHAKKAARATFHPVIVLARAGKRQARLSYDIDGTTIDGISILPDDESSTQRPQTLTTNPTYQLSDQSNIVHSTQQSSQASPTQSSTNSFHIALDDSHQSHSIGQQLVLEFGGMVALNNLFELEEACTTLFSPLFEFEYSKTDCSQLTRHMWAHACFIPFKS